MREACPNPPPWIRPCLAALLVVSAFSAPALGCIWFHGTDLQGFRVRIEGFPPATYVAQLTESPDFEDWADRRRRFEAQAPGTNDWKRRSDRAAFLIYEGKAVEAIPILEAVEAEQPGDYVTAANLGTAYELAGEDHKALQWIREGLRRNPESHQGTEWLHVLVLEAKLALKADPGWLERRHVLGLDLGGGDLPVQPAPAALSGRTPADIRDALEYQLHERLHFVKPPDRVVADLLFDLGNMLALTLTVEHAAAVYAKAIEYGVGSESRR